MQPNTKKIEVPEPVSPSEAELYRNAGLLLYGKAEERSMTRPELDSLMRRITLDDGLIPDAKNLKQGILRHSLVEREAYASDSKIQNQIIAMLARRNRSVDEGAENPFAAEKKLAFLESLCLGLYDDALISEQVLGKTPTSISEPESGKLNLSMAAKIFWDLETLPFAKRLFGLMYNLLDEKPAQIPAVGLVHFVKKFPDPLILEREVDKLTEDCLTAEERQSIQTIFDIFSSKIYGPRYDCLYQFRLLTKKAMERAATMPEEVAVESIAMDNNEIEEAKNSIVFHGSEYYESLDLKYLEQETLLPAYKYESNGFTVMFSRPYDFEGRPCVVAYMSEPADSGSDKKPEFVARSFYLSNSHALWKLLPTYVSGHFDKGYDETSVTLPAVLQQALSSVLSQEPVRSADRPETALFGAVRHGSEPKAKGTFLVQVSSEPSRLKGGPGTGIYGRLAKPESIHLTDPEEKPVFSLLISRWEQVSPMYGKVRYELFPSRDGRLRYTFCRDGKDRAWLGSVEMVGPLSSTGVKTKWIKTNDLTMPAYTYRQESGGYGNSRDSIGHYVDMFENYLSKIPLIQEYLNESASPKSRE